ncbi:importin subunit alpha-7 [Stylonychia lemnae]|uniref:Importin subunit alpha-7 n=1 Tax=Stylonychia lemnae TaxID=5949 RepID=A0A078AGS1_STYLE|nr:importin subunit alpha-7 [Stylonychia lemnae]|eukprot:CDW81041.1 importin subunit alpha-7 [Stylonychia lemnae]
MAELYNLSQNQQRDNFNQQNQYESQSTAITFSQFSQNDSNSKFLKVAEVDVHRKREEFAISLRQKNKNAKLSKVRAKITSKNKSPYKPEQDSFGSHPALGDMSLSPEDVLAKGLELLMNQSLTEHDQILIARRMRRAVNSDELFGERQEAIIYYSTLSRNDGREFSNLLDILQFSTNHLLLKEISWLLINLCIQNKQVADILEPFVNLLPKTINSIFQINEILSALMKEFKLSDSKDANLKQEIDCFQRVYEQELWYLSNYTHNNQELLHQLIVDYKLFELITTNIMILDNIKLDTWFCIQNLLKDITQEFKQEWFDDLKNFLSSTDAYLLQLSEIQSIVIFYPCLFKLLIQPNEQRSYIMIGFLRRITEQCDDNIIYLMDHTPLQSIIIEGLVQHEDQCMFAECLIILGNVLSCDDTSYSDQFYKNKIVTILRDAWQFHENNTLLNKDFCWIFSNLIITYNVKITNEILDNNFLSSKILEVLMSFNQLESKEASYIFHNMVLGGQGIEIIDRLVYQKDILDYFYQLIKVERNLPPKILMVVLNTLRKMFELDDLNGGKQYYNIFEQLGGVDELESQQYNPNQEIYSMVSDILVRFGNGEHVENQRIQEINGSHQQNGFNGYSNHTDTLVNGEGQLGNCYEQQEHQINHQQKGFVI